MLQGDTPVDVSVSCLTTAAPRANRARPSAHLISASGEPLPLEKRNLGDDQMRESDRIMFSIARELSIPITWNLAGGYQIEGDGSIPRVVELHLNTFEEALKVWRFI